MFWSGITNAAQRAGNVYHTTKYNTSTPSNYTVIIYAQLG